ncbi:MAG: peptidyl-tRNA hydrolase [Cyclobacteriaceae bacterium]|nr:MAG: peptidyl-tRNA hydrolase [Cyclobacteriaceae bacterium]
MKFLVAALGNIGAEYELTRHNIGFLIADRLADRHGASFTLSRHAFKTEIKHKGRAVHIIKPTTYMNLSGKAVAYWLQELKIEVGSLLVVVDDVALPFGKLRLRPKGSAAGHNGLKNIEETLGHSQYARLRFGIGNNYQKGQQVNYVLGNFSKEELDNILPPIDKACEMILSFCTAGIEKTMSQYND